MARSRARCKLALRFCRQHEDQLKVDAYAKSMDLGDGKKFWRDVKRISNGKATKYASCVDDVTRNENIAEMWRNHFASLYNSVNGRRFKNIFFDCVKNSCTDDRFIIMPQDVSAACCQQKNGKSAGPEGLHMEAYMYSCSRLCVHLSVLFNLFLSHHYLPNKFTESVIVPLVKAKSGNINDRNNYRAIALCLQHVNTNSDPDIYQFSLKLVIRLGCVHQGPQSNTTGEEDSEIGLLH